MKIFMAKNSAILSNDAVMASYKKMYLARRFEEKAGQMYGMGKIAGFCQEFISLIDSCVLHYR